MIDNPLLPAKSKMCIYKETSAQSAMHTVASKGHAVKSASLRRGSVANFDRALMLCTCVYISERTNIRLRIKKRAKTTE